MGKNNNKNILIGASLLLAYNTMSKNERQQTQKQQKQQTFTQKQLKDNEIVMNVVNTCVGPKTASKWSEGAKNCTFEAIKDFLEEPIFTSESETVPLADYGAPGTNTKIYAMSVYEDNVYLLVVEGGSSSVSIDNSSIQKIPLSKLFPNSQ